VYEGEDFQVLSRKIYITNLVFSIVSDPHSLCAYPEPAF
jgi:hypothetical protein